MQSPYLLGALKINVSGARALAKKNMNVINFISRTRGQINIIYVNGGENALRLLAGWCERKRVKENYVFIKFDDW